MSIDPVPPISKTLALTLVLLLSLLTAEASAQHDLEEDEASDRALWQGGKDDELDELFLDADCTEDDPCEVSPLGSTVDESGPYPLISIQPYFAPDHPYHAASARLEAGDCGGALQLAEEARDACQGCEGENAIGYLHARARFCTGEREQAWDALVALDDKGYPGMEIELRHTLRGWAKRLDKPLPPELPPAIATDGPSYVRRAIAVGRNKAKKGKLEEALAIFDLLEGTTRSVGVRRSILAARAEVLAKAGKKEDAAAIYFRLFRDTQGKRYAERMEERLERLGTRSSRYKLSREDRLDQLVSLAQKKRTKKRELDAYVRTHRRTLASTGRDRKALDALVTGVRLEARRERAKALIQFEKAEKSATDPVLSARILFQKGKALRRLDRDEEAIATYLRLAETWPTNRRADDALLHASRLSLYLGHYEDATNHAATLAALYPDSPRVGRAMWQGGWAAFLDKRYTQALGIFDALARHHGEETELSGLPLELVALYWRARALALTGKPTEASNTYRYVIERFPLTWYAAMAYHQIAALGHDPRSAVPFQPSFDEPLSSVRLAEFSTWGEVPGHPRVRRGLELWRLGRRAEARSELAAQLPFEGVPRGVVELVATFHLVDGNLPSSYHIASRYGSFSTAPWEGNARLWGLSHPAPPKVLEAAVDVGGTVDVDPLLAMAIIRHESSFRNDATSSVGAKGLMQLMPGTARSVNKLWYGESGPSAGKLRNTRTNLKMGMTLLRLLDQLYDKNLPLAVAGFNCGTGISSRWWETFKDLPTDALVEQMTYPLTRAYVKKVLGSYYAYRVLYGDGPPPPIPLKKKKKLGEWGPPKSDLVGSRMR